MSPCKAPASPSRLPSLFRKLGYETFGTADVFLDGHTRDCLLKKL